MAGFGQFSMLLEFFRVLVLLVLVTGLSGGASFAVETVSSQDKSEASKTQTRIGVDYLHFWLIWSAQRSGIVESVYRTDEHPAIVAWAHSLAHAGDGQRMRSHLAQSAELYESGLQPTGSPLLYGLLGILRTENYELDFWVFQFVSSLLFVFGVLLLGRIGNCSALTCLSLCVVLVIFFRPLRVDFGVANTNRVQFFLFGLMVWLLANNRPFFLWAGLVVGFAIAFKLNFALVPVLVVGGCLIDRRYRDALHFAFGCLAGLAVSVLIGAVLFGSIECWMQWRDYVAAVMKVPYSIGAGNYSMTALLGTDSNRYIPAALILLVLVGWLLYLLLQQQSHKKTALPMPLLGSLGLLIFLFISPLVWSHYFVLAIPAIVLLMARKFNSQCGFAWRNPVSWMTIVACLLFIVASTSWVATLAAPRIAGTLQAAVLLLIIGSLVEIAKCRTAEAVADDLI